MDPLAASTVAAIRKSLPRAARTVAMTIWKNLPRAADEDDMSFNRRRAIKDESHQTQSSIPGLELPTRSAQLNDLWEKKDREIRCLVEALELGDATGKMAINEVEPLVIQCHHTALENSNLHCQINSNDVAIAELQERCYSLRAKLCAMLSVSNGCEGNDTPLPDCSPPYGCEGNDDEGMHLKEYKSLSTVAMTLLKFASLSADAEKALRECCTLPEVSEFSAIPDERLLSEIEELHSENYEAKSSHKTSEGAVQQSEESLQKMDQEVKLLAELLRRNLDKFARNDTPFEFYKSCDKIWKKNACLKTKLDGTVRVLAAKRKRCSTYLEELSANLLAFRDEIGDILSRHDKTGGPKK